MRKRKERLGKVVWGKAGGLAQVWSGDRVGQNKAEQYTKGEKQKRRGLIRNGERNKTREKDTKNKRRYMNQEVHPCVFKNSTNSRIRYEDKSKLTTIRSYLVLRAVALVGLTAYQPT